jgi:hypothetical protein
MYRKIISNIWSIREFYLPFIIGIGLAISTLVFLGVFIKLLIYFIESFTLQFLLLHPLKNR